MMDGCEGRNIIHVLGYLHIIRLWPGDIFSLLADNDKLLVDAVCNIFLLVCINFLRRKGYVVTERKWANWSTGISFFLLRYDVGFSEHYARCMHVLHADIESVFICLFFGMNLYDLFYDTWLACNESTIILGSDVMDLDWGTSSLSWKPAHPNMEIVSISPYLTPNNQPLRVFLSSPRYRICDQESRGRESFCVWSLTSISKIQLTQLRLPA